jgi:uncharacterized membrane protein HdeD (DUF308 family)
MSTQTEASEQVESIQSEFLEGIKQNAGWAIAIGLISTIAGFLALWAPFIAGLSVTVVVGLYMVLRPGVGVLSLTLVLAIYFFATGISEIIGAFKMKRAKGWVWALFSGVVSLLLGILIWWQFPLSGDWAVGILTGIKMVFGGWWLIVIGNGFRTAAKAEEPAPT